MKYVKNCCHWDDRCMMPQLRKPQLDLNANKEIFRSLRHYQSKSLKTITLIAGDYARREGGGLRLLDLYKTPQPVI